MTGISEIRQKHPEYDDMSDQQLAEGLYKKYYSDMPKEEFDQKMGFNLAPSPQTAAAPVVPQAASSKPLLNQFQDLSKQISEGGQNFITQGGDVLGRGGVNALNFAREKLGYPDIQTNAFTHPGANTLTGQLGGAAGNVMQYMMPGAIGKAAMSIPGIANSLLGASNILSKVPGAIKSAVGMGAIGGLTAPEGERGQSAALSAAVPAGLGALGGAATGTKALINKAASKFAAPGLAKEGIESVSQPTITNEQAFDIAKQNHENYVTEEKQKWDALKNNAVIADYTPGVTFDNADYVKSLEDESNKLAQQSKEQSGFARKNLDSVNLLNQYKKDQHGTFSDAINHNQALNFDYKNEITPGKSLPFDTIKYSVGKLKNTIQKNLEDNGLQETLGKSFKDANKATQEKNQTFNTVVSPKGKEQDSSFLNFINQKNPWGGRGNFVNDYLPSGSKESLGRMQQFSKMLGNEDVAKSVIKNNYFDIQKGVTPPQFLNKYNSLSKEEQEYLFNPRERKGIDKLSSIVKEDPKALNQVSLFDLGQHAVGAGLGAVGGMAFGHPGIGSLAGLAGINVGRIAARKAMENPTLRNALLKERQPSSGLANNSLLNAGLTGTARNYLNQVEGQ